MNHQVFSIFSSPFFLGALAQLKDHGHCRLARQAAFGPAGAQADRGEGGYRVIFERDDAIRVIEVQRIGPRGDVYK